MKLSEALTSDKRNEKFLSVLRSRCSNNLKDMKEPLWRGKYYDVVANLIGWAKAKTEDPKGKKFWLDMRCTHNIKEFNEVKKVKIAEFLIYSPSQAYAYASVRLGSSAPQKLAELKSLVFNKK